MTDPGIKRLETWAQVGILVLMILAHMLSTESRLARVEQEIKDVRELILQTHREDVK